MGAILLFNLRAGAHMSSHMPLAIHMCPSAQVTFTPVEMLGGYSDRPHDQQSGRIHVFMTTRDAMQWSALSLKLFV